MKVEKKGVLRDSSPGTAFQSHKVWMGISVVLGVILLLVVFFVMMSGKEALFGKAITTEKEGTTSGDGTIISVGTDITQGEIAPDAIPCLNVQAIPVPRTGTKSSSTNRDKYEATFARIVQCQLLSIETGCTFTGFECPADNPDCYNNNYDYNPDVVYDPADDACTGTPNICLPNVIYSYNYEGVQAGTSTVNINTAVHNTARQTLCDSNSFSYAGTCYFHDRGGDASYVSGATSDYYNDACLPFGVEGAACSVGSTSGTWIYSYIPADDQTLFPPLTSSDGSRRIACCAETDACVAAGGTCRSYDGATTNQWVCGDDNNWDRCTGALLNTISDGGNYQCQLVATGTESTVYKWVAVPVEICTDNIDNDADTFIDELDSDCIGQACTQSDGSAGEVVWSYYPATTSGQQIGKVCCSAGSCGTTSGTCIASGAITPTSTYYCTSEQDWLLCSGGSSNINIVSPNGNYICERRGGEEGETFWYAVEEVAAPPADVSGDIVVDSTDVTLLLYVLLAQSDGSCGGSSQTICDYSGDGIFACDAGTVYAMSSETDLTHAADVCTETVGSGDVSGDGVTDSTDITLLLYVLLAQSDGSCGGSSQTICDYSGDGIFACDAGTVYAMSSETDLTHAADVCS